jgi:hypothetical protein
MIPSLLYLFCRIARSHRTGGFKMVDVAIVKRRGAACPLVLAVGVRARRSMHIDVAPPVSHGNNETWPKPTL